MNISFLLNYYYVSYNYSLKYFNKKNFIFFLQNYIKKKLKLK